MRSGGSDTVRLQGVTVLAESIVQACCTKAGFGFATWWVECAFRTSVETHGLCMKTGLILAQRRG